MTREEAIEIFEQKGWWIAQKETLTSKQAEEIIKLNDAVNFALSALRPAGREQVELYTNRLWPGCPRCSMTKDEAFDAGGAHEFRVLGDSLYYCDSNYGWEGEKIGYCPWCGKPLGKATELKHIEKLEVLLND